MRLPSAPDAPNFEETGPIRVATGARDPSYPDRARIDSDVRYLLRPPSTPWITFDRDHDRDPKEEILTSSRASVIDAPRLFPDAPAAVSTVPVEPSNVVVATDIRPAEPSLHDITHDEPHLPPVAHPRRIMLAVGAALGLAAMIVASVFVLGSTTPSSTTIAAPAPSVPAEITPPPADVAPTPAPPTTTTTEPKVKDGWAKLTIKGRAKSHRVYLDGKMLLGKGARSFTIRCGEHAIAVGNKADAKDVDVPCNAEYVVSK
jgi:hypothetical protein